MVLWKKTAILIQKPLYSKRTFSSVCKKYITLIVPSVSVSVEFSYNGFFFDVKSYWDNHYGGTSAYKIYISTNYSFTEHISSNGGRYKSSIHLKFISVSRSSDRIISS